MPNAPGVWGPVLVAALFGSLVFPQDQVTQSRSRFAHESDPVRKARLMPDLGDAEFAEIRKDVEAGHLPDALSVLQEYRDEAQSCVKALGAAGIDAEKHSSGFKQLEISLQESLRRLDALLPNMTVDEQAPFLEVRKDLDNMNRHLIEELFPRRAPPAEKPEKPGQ